MFTIYDGRAHFYQWDTEQKLIVKDNTVLQVHFANCLCANARVCETYTEDGITLVDVPNDLLTQDYDIKVWGYDGSATKHCATFEVVKRTKPEDYIYTEAELKTWEKLGDLIKKVTEMRTDATDNQQIEGEYPVLLDLPIDVYTNFTNTQLRGTGARTPDNPITVVSTDSITLTYSTDYMESQQRTIEFDKPFITGEIEWTNGTYSRTREKVKLDTSKLVMGTVTNNGISTIVVYTTFEAQGWEPYASSSRTSTQCNYLPYSTSTTIKYKFYMIGSSGQIVMFLGDELKDTSNESLELAKQRLEGAEFVYVLANPFKGYFESIPKVWGSQSYDDICAYLYVDSHTTPTRFALSYHTPAGASTNERVARLEDFIYDELDTRVVELEDSMPVIETVRIEYDYCSDQTYDDIREWIENYHLVTYRYEDEYGKVYITTNAILNYEDEYVHVFFPDYEFRLFSGGGDWEEV